MFHGVSSFWRRQTAFLNVLQSGAYANSPIFHQPCDTTDHSAITYLMGPDGKFIRHFPYGIDPKIMAEQIKKILG